MTIYSLPNGTHTQGSWIGAQRSMVGIGGHAWLRVISGIDAIRTKPARTVFRQIDTQPLARWVPSAIVIS